MKGLIRGAMKAIAPGYYKKVSDERARRHTAALAERLRKSEAAFRERHGGRILAGPFAGMEYIEEARCSALLPKLLGSYERELFPTIEAMYGSGGYDLVIDVGCAEGYYAVGLARKWRRARVVAYDIDPKARELCGQLAEKNGVSDRVEVREACTPAELQARVAPEIAAGKRVLVIADCEGYEDVLLDLKAAPALSKCDVVVEIHECFVAGLTERLKSRLAGTHALELISSMARDARDYPQLSFLPAEGAAEAVSEYRPAAGMQWGVWRAKR